MEFKVGDTFKTKELADLFQITSKSFSSSKPKRLEYLSHFVKLEEIKRGKYMVKKVYIPHFVPNKKNCIGEYFKEKVSAVYKEGLSIPQIYNLIKKDKIIKLFNLAENTTFAYIGTAIREITGRPKFIVKTDIPKRFPPEFQKKIVKSGIYAIKSGDEVLYVGQFKDLRARWLTHEQAIRDRVNDDKYATLSTIEDRYYEVLEYCPVEELDVKELKYTALYTPKLNKGKGVILLALSIAKQIERGQDLDLSELTPLIEKELTFE